MNILKNISNSTKSVDLRLFSVLLLMGLLPTIYTTVRIFFLGSMPGEWGFNIASQLSWINLLYEIVQEALILPLFFFIGAVLTNAKELQNRVRSGLIVTFAIYTTLSVLIIIFSDPLVRFMAQNTELIPETVTYIRLETVANIFSTLVSFITIVLVTIKKEKYLYVILVLKMVLSILLDTFFVSPLDISLNLGVNGIAYTNIIVNIFILLLSVSFLYKENIRIFTKEKIDFKWLKSWGKVGSISGLESFVRNIAYMLMIVRMVNVVGEQGTFWVANNFIWGWLLIPVLQLGELIKRDSGEKGVFAISQKSLGYIIYTTAFIIIWIITIPAWKPFMHHILAIDNYIDVYNIVIISLVFYMFYAYNNIIDSIFYGIGRTDYMLFQSLVINTVYYGLLYILYICGIYQPTLVKIALMFALGIALDSVLTYVMFVYVLKKNKINILSRTVKNEE